jgi:hypothetical protein
MKFQRATIEITCINNYFVTTPATQTWDINLSGEFTETSESLIGGRPRVIFLGKAIDLNNPSVHVTLKPFPSGANIKRKEANEPWESNSDFRDTLRIDGLNEGGFVNSQLSVYLSSGDIEKFRSVNLMNQRLIINIQYMTEISDPRPLTEPNTDHIFAYLSETSIHLLSMKNGYQQSNKFSVLEEEDSQPLQTFNEDIKVTNDLLSKLYKSSENISKLISFLLIATISFFLLFLLHR